ncbi:serine hydrolase [Longimicrobium terrae]|uniref:CubicO group peptidase (Beta-lactamase class C family) n=1 Tax=Longimicrobium terrae TaxID=1639882 RepID=A0A841GWP2_9BACT|nr:CubicO group peptidase (beta-lactamase class C family) [Longimicrobium terrae]MBB6069655.1 CubicO group peptidase (beta-lactamase class C family) [Longimicrobium terrae]NNC31134.1 beta-lactamase family protein [Longimicrobium terrae]
MRRLGRVDGLLMGGVVLGLGLGLATAAGSRRPAGPPVPEPPGAVERFLTPAPVPIPSASIAKAESLISRNVRGQAFPGAAFAAGNREQVEEVKGFGRIGWSDSAAAVSPDSTRYDLASLTKVVATTAAVMALVEDRKLDLDDPVRDYVPEFSGGAKDRVTIRHLLTHTAGLRAGAADIVSDDPAAVRRYIITRPLIAEPGVDVLYSDLGFAILWAVAEKAAGEPLGRYLKWRVWAPLGMTATEVGVRSPCADCAPTLYLENSDEPYTGGSYDEVARRLGGYGGNAGAFSTVRDLSRFAAMIANEGRLGDIRIFQRRTVRGFVRPQPGAGTRALGWEVYCREGVVPDSKGCENILALGHTGVTGTCLWIDPVSRTWFVLLTNRTYLPKQEIDMQMLRRRVFRALAPAEE